MSVWMHGIFKAIAWLGEVLAGCVLVGMTFYTVIEIVLRSTIGVASNEMVEFVGYGLAIMTFLGAAQATRDGAMLRINLLLFFLSARVKRVLEIICVIAGIATISFMTWYFVLDMHRSYLRGYETDGVLALPLWLPPLGLVLGALVFVAEMVRQLVLLVTGKAELTEAQQLEAF